MLTSDTKRRIDSCRDILVGKLPLPTDQVELITLALIYKFMDDLDEESVNEMRGERSFFRGPLQPYRWRELMSQMLSAEERMTRFADGLELLGGGKKLRLPKKAPKKNEEPTEEIDVAAHLPALFRDIFRNAFLKFRDGRILTLFLTELSGFAYSHSEELGNAFEYILSVMGAQGDNGQFRTPRHVIDFMVACLDPQPGQTVLDPACGTGGFLVSAFRHVRKHHTSPESTVALDRLTHTQRQRLYAAFTGYDINDQMVKLSRVNLFLHDFATPQIHIYDTLTNDARWPEKYDLILANPPFMTPKGGVVPHTRFRVPAKKAEVLFTDYIAEHLTPDGRAGIVVPNGIVATTQTAYVKLRRFLVEESLVAVVSLPAGCFKPYSGVKTSILLLDKKLARTTDQILFLKIAADGFDLGDKRTPIEANDLPEAERVIRAWLTGKLGDDFASPLAWKVVGKRDVLDNSDCSFSADRYLGVAESENSAFPLVPVGRFMKEGVKTLDPRSSPNELFELWSIPAFDAGRPELIRGEEIGSQKKVVGPRDVLLSRIIPHIRRGWVVRENPDARRQVASTEWIVFSSDELVPEFLRAVLVSDVFHRSFMQTVAGVGGSLSRANPNAVADIQIPLPPLEEQRRIVAEIEGYQQVIDGARQILAAYQIVITPEPHWPWVTFEEICERLQYGLSTPLKEEGNGVKTFRMAEIVGGRAFDDGTMKRADIDAKERAKYWLAKGDILFNRTNSFEHVGRTGIFTLDGDYAFASYLVRLSIKRDLADPEFVNAWMNTKAFQTGVKSLASRAVGQSNISASSLAGYTIPLPPKPEQERIVAELEAEAAKVEAVRGLLPLYEAKIQRTLARVWGTGV